MLPLHLVSAVTADKGSGSPDHVGDLPASQVTLPIKAADVSERRASDFYPKASRNGSVAGRYPSQAGKLHES